MHSPAQSYRGSRAATKPHPFAAQDPQPLQHWSQTPLQCLVSLRVWRKAFSIPCLPSHLLDSYFLLFQPTAAVVTAGNLISAEIMANFMWEMWRELFHSELIKCIFRGTAQYPVQKKGTFLSPAKPQHCLGHGLVPVPWGQKQEHHSCLPPWNCHGENWLFPSHQSTEKWLKLRICLAHEGGCLVMDRRFFISVLLGKRWPCHPQPFTGGSKEWGWGGDWNKKYI